MTRFIEIILILVSILFISILCESQLGQNGTDGRDIDGPSLIKLGRKLNKPMLTVIGMAISNLHRCSGWTQWTECDVTRANFFGIRNRTRNCIQEEGTSVETSKTETDLGICEGSEVVKTKSVCPSTYNTTKNGFCIKLYVIRKSHDEAETVCESDGGYLINIDSDLKYEDVKSVLKGFSVIDINIGGRRKDAHSPWEFKYGSGSYSPKWFDSNYPMAASSRKCLALENNLWFNLMCSSAYPFLCEIVL